MNNQWSLEEVENHLNVVIKAAAEGYPQFICNNGVEKAVLVSSQAWRKKLQQLECADNMDSDSDHETEPQKTFVEALFSMPQGDCDLPKPLNDFKLRKIKF